MGSKQRAPQHRNPEHGSGRTLGQVSVSSRGRNRATGPAGGHPDGVWRSVRPPDRLLLHLVWVGLWGTDRGCVRGCAGAAGLMGLCLCGTMCQGAKHCGPGRRGGLGSGGGRETA